MNNLNESIKSEPLKISTKLYRHSDFMSNSLFYLFFKGQFIYKRAGRKKLWKIKDVMDICDR